MRDLWYRRSLWDLWEQWGPWGLWVLFGMWDLRSLCAPGSRWRFPHDSLTGEAPVRDFLNIQT